MELKKSKKEKLSNLFVYGTLQAGQSRNYILKGLKYKKATLFNYRKVQPPSLDPHAAGGSVESEYVPACQAYIHGRRLRKSA